MIILKDDWQDARAWDDFVERQEQARFCQLFGYAAALKCYGYTPRNICFLKEEKIVGVLPAVQLHSLIFGRKLVSQPFSEYGGLLLDPGLEEDEVGEIFEALKIFGRTSPKVSSIEMHGNYGISQRWREKWPVASAPHQIAILPLNRPVDDLWHTVVRYSVRKAVNQARKNGLEVVSECNEEAIRDRFFPLYLQSMKRLGAPPHKVDYYINCYRTLGSRMIILWAKHNGADVAALLGFSCANRINIINTVSNPGDWHLRPNDFLHWEFIKRAAESNHRNFDFGTVRYQGQMDFKKKWGCEIYEYKHYFVETGNKMLPRTLDSSSKSMQIMAALWSRHMPLAAGRLLGPLIRKQLAR
jgi:hypothetical protein